MGNELKKKAHHVPFTQQTVDINLMPYSWQQRGMHYSCIRVALCSVYFTFGSLVNFLGIVRSYPVPTFYSENPRILAGLTRIAA